MTMSTQGSEHNRYAMEHSLWIRLFYYQTVSQIIVVLTLNPLIIFQPYPRGVWKFLPGEESLSATGFVTPASEFHYTFALYVLFIRFPHTRKLKTGRPLQHAIAKRATKSWLVLISGFICASDIHHGLFLTKTYLLSLMFRSGRA